MPDSVYKRPRLTAGQQTYADLIPRPAGESRGLDSNGEPLPPVPQAPMFRRPPVVVSQDPAFLDAVERLLHIAPELQGQLPSITQGHTGASIREHIDSGMAPDSFGHTTLLGVTDRKTKEIGISPALRRNRVVPPGERWNFSDMDDTLAHEAAHAAGYEELDADALGALMSTDQGNNYDPETTALHAAAIAQLKRKRAQ